MLNPAAHQNIETMENAEEKHSIMPNHGETKEQTEPHWKTDNEEDNKSEIEGLDEEGESIVPISDQSNVRLDERDRSLFDLKRWHDAGDLTLDPEWQRNFIWNRKQSSKLIESFLLEIPVPVIYLAKTKEDKYEVIDGLQRLTSVFNFFDNKYALTSLDQLKDQIGKKFKDLDKPLQRRLENAPLRTFELSSHTNPNIYFIVFERLNTGGTKLNEMEIRNCLYRGKLNHLIKELAASESFKSCVHLTDTNVKRMLDRALILRFLAFYERTYLKCEEPPKRFLNVFMETFQNPKPEKIQEYRRKFEHCIRASKTVFGEYGFRLKREHDPKKLKGGYNPGKSTSYGEWSNRINAPIFQCVMTSFAKYDLGQITRAADRIYEEYLDLTSTDKDWIDRVRRATGSYARVVYVFETWQRRLAGVMQDVPPNDGRRTFSKQLKKELFEQNNTCSLCGQEIKMLDDAVLDHDKHYWRGGATIPDNARLVHRFCNQSRGGR